MVAQYKCLQDGTGQGKGWILVQNLEKARFIVQKQEESSSRDMDSNISRDMDISSKVGNSNHIEITADIEGTMQ